MSFDTSVIVAVAAVAGSAVGACASVATTFVTQRLQTRSARLAAELDRHEELYGKFVEEAVPLFIDALEETKLDPAKLMRVFSIMGRIRLTASDEVLRAAEEVSERLVETYARPPEDPAKVLEQLFKSKDRVDPLLDFTVACRRERAQALRNI